MKLQIFCRRLVILAFLLGTVHRISGQGPKRAAELAAVDRVAAKYPGGLVSPPAPKPRFTLTDTSGAPYDLQAKTQGYVTLLFFGYTHCPDMCPLQMNMIARALKTLSPAVQSQFTVVFVTTDPERDTPQVLRSWLDHFDKRLIGPTGSEAAIEAAQIAANLSPPKKSAVRA